MYLQDSIGDADTENRFVNPMVEGEGRMNWKSNIERCVLPYVKQTASGNLYRELKPGACDDLEEWDVVGAGREGTYVYPWLTHVDVQQKLSQYCKAVILQLKIKNKMTSKKIKYLCINLTKEMKDLYAELLLFSHPVDPMDCSMPGLPVPHHLLAFAQVHVHWISDTIQPSHPLMPSSPSALSLPLCQDLFQWVGCSHQVTKILELQFQH